MRVPDSAIRPWLTALGGSSADLTKGWNPIISHEMRESGWEIPTSGALFGATIPIPKDGPETSKKVVVAEIAGDISQVFLVVNL
ncbi:hypothetical protein ACIP93_37615 [Streptomyces sp. NPDC088745]|uniref:hypothetical protein n=1 Tax=Streptomyces sp. NPDC088745 TaxID=3365884 RepID=UPI0037F4F357